MGKQRKQLIRRSSVNRILHEALTGFTPAVAGVPFCPIQRPDKTQHSSRHLLAGFNNSVHRSTPPSPAASYRACDAHDGLLPLLQDRGHVEEEADPVSVSVSAAAKSSTTSTCSSCLSSSSSSSSSLPAATGAGSDDPLADEEFFFPPGTISSTRFFFSPCSSKSIATREVVDGAEHLSCRDSSTPGGMERAGEVGGDDVVDRVVDTFARSSTREAETTIINPGWTRSTTELISPGIFFPGGTPTAMASRDPYGDFRSSMEEMVTAGGRLWDWASLEELLRCYLRLNESATHRCIVLAFLDLLTQLPLHPCRPV